MQGYCQNCFKMMDVDEVKTLRLPNMSFIQRGVCSTCRGVIFVKIPDHKIIIDAAGHKSPMEVFVGPGTPKKLINRDIGQRIFEPGGIRESKIKTEIVTVFEVIQKKIDEATVKELGNVQKELA